MFINTLAGSTLTVDHICGSTIHILYCLFSTWTSAMY